ncbi:TPA: imidazole glycerol phosphate synthase subunit HisF [Legionella pneumophila]|uniref:imidazole glycerol phosphate synthase subunit HisF n=1 Tax=Legionella pneumophila TaxID=446 RepID=UPI0009836DE2|nr:imidazole glycerol phosphate synthase cyclase subunit [Legionella pneumophila]OOK44535.1 imidazoleglycerol-phosphate synthase [Legionella pneumophila subsp. pneumophila str. Mississauga]HAT1977317.1 imidazole glycerol phosphate synthase subunit HisF [Legionella pneumophila]HAT2038993.1 imidazole glycerol phosphate synthase subunit HisF [Legionella pneumophila]HBD7082052.1 imidazole glycerol phosphate synthase subunit HisF [Legionella pneumophila]HCU6104553.1 imidazole glycerol phosphate syn
MLKKRIIPIQLLLNNRLVKTVQFNSYRDVGDPVASSSVYNSQYADELIFLNISRENTSITPLLEIIDKVSSVCFMPLSVGGGIRTFEDVRQLISLGADKVVLNSACFHTPELITQIAERYGSQAIIIAIDVRWDAKKNCYTVYSNCGQSEQDVDLINHINLCINMGAGELLIQSIDRDGMMQGYDIALAKQIMDIAQIPVIICGGAGHYNHLKEAFSETDISAVACGSLFNFTDSNLIRAKAFLSNYQLHFKVV